MTVHTLARRGRLPAYAKELVSLDLPRWLGLLFVADDFRAAQRLKGAPRLVITPADDPWTLDLRLAQRALVTILAASYGPHLMPMVEALAVAGARAIVLRGPDGEWFDALIEGSPHAVWCPI